ncbi:MAG: PPC domain-containing protein, partial [Deltaproteobacteria bacterium]|nr:PPC domain-containing protein [Deltaproteobacteria bacterium]
MRFGCLRLLGPLLLAAACGLETGGLGAEDGGGDPTEADGVLDTPPDLPDPDEGGAETDLDGDTPEDAPPEDAPEADTVPVCGNDVAEDGEACDGPDLAGLGCTDLGFHDGVLACTADCTFDTAACTAGCTDACPVLDERRCRGTAVEVCAVAPDGCRTWTVERDCALETAICDDGGGAAATCLGGDGDSCDSPRVLATLPLDVRGPDMLAAFHNHHDFRDPSCLVASGVEAVFARWMTAGETIRIRETGTIDVVFRVLTECSDAGRCLAGRNDPESVGLTFTAPADGNYFFVVEAVHAATASRAYDITLEDAPDGNVCGDPHLADPLPFNRSGGDLATLYTDDHRFTGAGCHPADGVEAVLARTMTAGETVRLRETGSMDAVLRVLDRCEATAPCLASRDMPEDPGLAFTAPADGTYYFVVEARLAFPTARGFNFTLEEAPDGDVCGDPIPVADLPTTVAAGDFHLRFTDDVRFTGAGCSPADGAEAYFARAMAAGETVRLRETGTLDATLRVLASCDPAAPCLGDRPEPENPGLTFTAPAAGTYYFVVEATLAAPPARGYSMTVDDPPPGNVCGDPLIVTSLPFSRSGGDLAIDFTNDTTFTDTSCDPADGAELILRVDAAEGDSIVLSEAGSLDAVLRVLESCSSTATCLY